MQSVSALLDEYFAPPPHFDDRLRFDLVRDHRSGTVRRTCRATVSSDRSCSTVCDSEETAAQLLPPDVVLAGPHVPVTAVLDKDEANSAEFVEDAADVFCVGPCSSARWRTYIDCSKWTPNDHHDELLMDRAYHAKMVYETSLLLELCDKAWVTRKTIEHLRMAAMLNLRTVEIHIASFQLTTRQVGLRRNTDLLYRAATLAHGIHQHVYELFCDIGNVKKVGRGKQAKSGAGPAPSVKDACPDLVRCIDTNVHAIHMFLKLGGPAVLTPDVEISHDRSKRLCHLLTLLIRTLDDVLYVVT